MIQKDEGPSPRTAEQTMHLAYAEASIMLFESLIWVLRQRHLVEIPEIVAAIESVIETKRREVDDGEHARISQVAIGVLSRMANSVASDRRQD
jgi:hypothetical protein